MKLMLASNKKFIVFLILVLISLSVALKANRSKFLKKAKAENKISSKKITSKIGEQALIQEKLIVNDEMENFEGFVETSDFTVGLLTLRMMQKK